MAINPEVDGLVTVQHVPEPDAQRAGGRAWPAEAPQGATWQTDASQPDVAFAEGTVPLAALETQVEAAPAVPPARTRSPRPRWVVPAAIAVVGLVVSGMLGYFLYATIQQRDLARHQLSSTQATLASTQDRLTAAQADAAERKLIADYVSLYIADSGKVQTDYESVVNCTDYSSCRTAAQQMLTDMQAFQTDRQAASVPTVLTSSDSTLGDSLSAGIVGVQELITGMDKDDLSKIKDGGSKVDAAMLNMDKAESSLGSALR